jgi:KaiC/GvpD/RAD55 family RecA-like ATPase
MRENDHDFKELGEHKSLGNSEPNIIGNIKIKHSLTEANADRTSTGILGLDEVIEGGLKRNSITLVGGCAGAGKSIFAMNYIVNGILKFNEPGVYITFEEGKEQVYQDMLRFGWDLAELERQNKFAFVEYTTEQVSQVLKTGGGIVRDIVDKTSAKRIVIDSLSAFILLHKDELERREACLGLFKLLRKWACTTLVIGQYHAAEEKDESNAVEFEADAIIWLYNIKKEDIRIRAIEVFKMRGTKHAAKTFPFEITQNGVVIYPEQSVF